MIEKATIIYTIIDDILKAMRHKQDIRQKMTDAEVITTALIAAIVFSGNIGRAKVALYETGLIPDMLEKSRLSRRIHAISSLVETIFFQLGMVLKKSNIHMEYVLDSFPVAVCDNIRIKRSCLIKGEEFRGYIVSKRRYFYGVKVHIICTYDGIPVEAVFVPGACNDSVALYELPFDLPEGSEVYTDSAYTNYSIEDELCESYKIKLCPQRKVNSKRQEWWVVESYKRYMRKRVETVFSQITNLFPKKIHAVTFEGFLIKVFLFVLGFTMDKAFC